MALQHEVWITDIKDQLFKPNPFMNRATNHSMYVNYKTVHVPQAGTAQTVKANRAVLPATISQRTDTELTYSLNEYTSDPILLTNIEELQINYDKRASVLNQTNMKLSEVVANKSLYAWAPSGASRIVRTTGTAAAAYLPHSTATGTRKAITLADLASARAILDNDNVPMEGRVLLMTANMYNNEFLAISNVQQYLSYGQAVLPTGVVNKIFGFDIMIRPTVLLYDNTGTPVIKSVDDEGEPTLATTDNAAALVYHPNFVAHALGDIKVFADEDKPEYYGSIFSSLVMHGASKLRTDQKGVVAIVQGQ